MKDGFVSVIGLGNMGRGMAETLLRNGYKVMGYDLSEEARSQAEKIGVIVAPLAQLLKESKVVVLSLPKAEHVEALALGINGISELGHDGLIIVDTTTSTAEVSRKIYAELKTKGMTFIDAPVSGGPNGAKTGTMTMVVGATEEDFANIQPFLADLSAVQVNVGECGAGNVVKICNNLLAAAHLIITAEAVALANKAGVSPEKLLSGLNKGSGRSAVSEVNFPRWILNGAFDSGFTMGLMRKDVGLADALATAENMNLPLSKKVMELWKKSAETLADQEDFDAIVKMTDADLFKGK